MWPFKPNASREIIRNCVSEKVAAERCVLIKLLSRLLHCRTTAIPRGLRRRLFRMSQQGLMRFARTWPDWKITCLARAGRAAGVTAGSSAWLRTATHCRKCAWVLSIRPQMRSARPGSAKCVSSNLVFVRGDRLHQGDQLALYGLVLDLAIGPQQPQAECAVEEQQAFDLARFAVAVVEERDGYIEGVAIC